MRKSCVDKFYNRALLSLRFILEEASELGFLSIKISLLVFVFSIFYCSTGICCNIYVYVYYNTSSTLQVVSLNFPLQKIWECFFRVEICTTDLLKEQIYVVQWVKQRLGNTIGRKYKRFMGLLETKFHLVGNLYNPCWYPLE
jgi:hypothetical protein